MQQICPVSYTHLWLDETLFLVVKKMESVRERSACKIPAVAVKGVHDDRSDESIDWDMDNGINWWTNGFFGGILWQLYHHTKDGRYGEIARVTEEKLDRCFSMYYGLHHDVGFIDVYKRQNLESTWQGYGKRRISF